MNIKKIEEEKEAIVEIKKRIAQIVGILNGSAIGDTGQAVIAEQKLGQILELLPQAITQVVQKEKKKIRQAWEKLDIVPVGSVGLSQGLLVQNSWGETDSMQVDKLAFKNFIKSIYQTKKEV